MAAIKRHRWMQAEVPEEEKGRESPAAAAATTTTESGKPAPAPPPSKRRCDQPVNEAILKIMADLGIDTSVTREVSVPPCSRHSSCGNPAQ